MPVGPADIGSFTPPAPADHTKPSHPAAAPAHRAASANKPGAGSFASQAAPPPARTTPPKTYGPLDPAAAKKSADAFIKKAQRAAANTLTQQAAAVAATRAQLTAAGRTNDDPGFIEDPGVIKYFELSDRLKGTPPEIRAAVLNDPRGRGIVNSMAKIIGAEITTSDERMRNAEIEWNRMAELRGSGNDETRGGSDDEMMGNNNIRKHYSHPYFVGDTSLRHLHDLVQRTGGGLGPALLVAVEPYFKNYQEKVGHAIFTHGDTLPEPVESQLRPGASHIQPTYFADLRKIVGSSDPNVNAAITALENLAGDPAP